MKRFHALTSAAAVLCSIAAAVLPARPAQTVSAETRILNGWRYTVNGDGSSVTVTACDRTDPVLTIPPELDGLPVTAVGENAFSGNTDLTELTIPEGVLRIGAYACYDCTKLQTISFPASLTEIGGNAFTAGSGIGIPWLREQIRAHTLVTVNQILVDGRFAEGAVTIPEGITEIAESAFSGAAITAVSIPDSVTHIGGEAFCGCAGLADITIPETVTDFGCDALRGTAWMDRNIAEDPYVAVNGVLLTAPQDEAEPVIPEGITKIGGGAFAGAKAMTGITIPETVTEIGESAFRGCTGLTAVTVPDSVTKTGRSAFQGCTTLKSAVLPDSTGTLADNLFYGCTGLTSFAVPDSVTVLGDSVFCECGNLGTITLPDGLQRIGNSCFYGCTALKALTLPDSLLSVGSNAFCRCTSLTALTVPDAVTGIGAYTFYGCSSLRQISLPDSADFIGAYAFCDCEKLSEITIPDSVREIGVCAFYNCTALTDVTVPAGVRTVSEHAFGGSGGLTLRGWDGTAAERFAEAEDIPFESLGALAVDIDRNGSAEIADAVLLIRLLAEDGTIPAQTAAAMNLSAADADGDGILTAADVAVLLRFLTEQGVTG